MTEEKSYQAQSGWLWLIVSLLLLIATIAWFVAGIIIADEMRDAGAFMFFAVIVPFVVGLLVSIFLMVGLFILQPNEAAVIILFGDYLGTVKDNGFLWRNPLANANKVSLRARNLNGDRLKVNDKDGNPIEIAVVVVWKVRQTAQAFFDVDDYQDYVNVQSEAAVRHLAGFYPYDSDDDELSLRGGKEEINEKMLYEMQDRLNQAGVEVLEARITHLAYAPEIAGAMLRRQQAQAVIAARQRIVEGAVGMVEMALKELDEKQVLELDPDRRAAMVSNLLVVLCGDEQAHPVVNTGTLYQ